MPDVRGDYRRCLQSDGGVRMGDIPSLMQGYGQVIGNCNDRGLFYTVTLHRLGVSALRAEKDPYHLIRFIPA